MIYLAQHLAYIGTYVHLYAAMHFVYIVLHGVLDTDK
jgi:hypothetical protein